MEEQVLTVADTATDAVAPPAPEVELPPLPMPPCPVSPEKTRQLAEFDLETLRIINEVCDEVTECEEDWITKNAEAKKAKEALDSGKDRLRKVIAERREARGKPIQRTLFDQVQESSIPLAETLPITPGVDPLEHLWRDFPLARLTNWGATENDMTKLAEGTRKRDNPHPLMTVGGMADYTANAGGDPAYVRALTDYKGIGSAAATRIDTALEGFYGWYNRGGREEFARERNLLPPLEPTHASPDGAGQDPGGAGAGDQGQPDGAAVEPDHVVESAGEAEAPEVAADGTYRLPGGGEDPE